MLNRITPFTTEVSILRETPVRCGSSHDQSICLITIIHAEEPLAYKHRHLSRRKVNTIDTTADPFRQSVLREQAQLAPPLLTETTISLPS